MADELPIIGISSSSIDIVTTLISSAASIHNTNKITRAEYAKIQAALEVYNGTLDSHASNFADKMQRQREELDKLHKALDLALDSVNRNSGEHAAIWSNIVSDLLQTIAQVHKDGPPITNISMNL